MRGSCAIVGIGVTRQGVGLGIASRSLRAQAIDLALADAGVESGAVDGYIHAWHEREDLRFLGLAPNFSLSIQSGGASAIMSILTATALIEAGQADFVLCVYGQSITSGGANEINIGAVSYGYPALYGLIGAAATHAFHARRHMHLHGTTSEHLAAVAVTQRDYATVRPGTLGYGKPITLEDHQTSPMIADPFRRFDCTRSTDGGVALLITSTRRAQQLKAKPIYILGAGTGHNIANWHKGCVYDNHDNIAPAKARAFNQAQMTIADINMAQLYDPFTISPIMQLEAYGVIPAGQGGPFYSEGGARSDGLMPTNTGGGQLSAYYATGFTPVIEAVLQLRGEAGAGQLKRANTALVSGHGLNGGVQNSWTHGTMILGQQP